ncbi:uncharacterized protein [Amphiura filiformis]|uniref:uncharacterized protein n=1 Tax=Amphiura filiformis TaxID=82378 RepID=UPI003B2181AF
MSMHNGIHTEPLPKPTGLDPTSMPKQNQSKTGPLPGYTHPSRRHQYAAENGDNLGASYNPHASPHRVSTFREVHPPPHLHSALNGHYATEPLPQSGNTPVEHSYGTVPLQAHVGRRVQNVTAQARHTSLPPDGAVGGAYSGLNAEMAKLRIGSAAGFQDASSAYYHGPPPISSSNSAPLPRPDHMRPYIPPSPNISPHQPPMSAYGQNHPSGHPNLQAGNHPSGHPNLQAGNHPIHQAGHQYHPSMYPSGGHHGYASSLPPRISHQQLYPSLPVDPDAHIKSYPNPQSHHRYVENIQSGAPELNSRRRNFLANNRKLYGEKLILEVFEKYPNETNEQRLHQRIQQHGRF